jgi:hypothetical protein
MYHNFNEYRLQIGNWSLKYANKNIMFKKNDLDLYLKILINIITIIWKVSKVNYSNLYL